MRKDQIFVLMLVILLPMSGCFDGAVGDAEADSSSVKEVTSVSEIITIQLDPGAQKVMTLNNNALEFVSGWLCYDHRDYCQTYSYMEVVIDCDNSTFYTSRYNFNGFNVFTPNRAGMECDLIFTNPIGTDDNKTLIYSFVEHPFAE
jgi:hypothetical protein